MLFYIPWNDNFCWMDSFRKSYIVESSGIVGTGLKSVIHISFISSRNHVCSIPCLMWNVMDLEEKNPAHFTLHGASICFLMCSYLVICFILEILMFAISLFGYLFHGLFPYLVSRHLSLHLKTSRIICKLLQYHFFYIDFYVESTKWWLSCIMVFSFWTRIITGGASLIFCH